MECLNEIVLENDEKVESREESKVISMGLLNNV